MKVAAINGNDITQPRHLAMDERPITIIGVGVSQLGKEVDARCPHGSIVLKNGTKEGASGNGGNIANSKLHRRKEKAPASGAQVTCIVVSPSPDGLIALQRE